MTTTQIEKLNSPTKSKCGTWHKLWLLVHRNIMIIHMNFALNHRSRHVYNLCLKTFDRAWNLKFKYKFKMRQNKQFMVIRNAIKCMQE